MNLNLTLIEENRRNRIVVLRINRRDLLINRRLAHSRHSQHTPHYTQTSRTSHQLSSNVIFKHRLQLAWWTRQQDNRGALMIDEHAGRSPIRIRQNLGVFNHHCLARIALRHRHPKTLETLSNLGQHNLVKQQPSTERTRGDLARDVVLSWTKPTSGDYDFRPAHCIFDCFFEEDRKSAW